MIRTARRLSYAGSLPGRWAGVCVRLLEWSNLSTPRLLWRMRVLAAGPVPKGLALCDAVLEALGIEIMASAADRVPHGPLVIVANHPTGMLDGAALLKTVSQVRTDVRIMARSLADDVPQVAPLLLSVPYDHTPGRRQALATLNRKATAHLSQGGAVLLFPAGRISDGAEAEWSPYALRLANRAGASVLPVRILEAPSCLYRHLAKLHPVFRQGVLLHEILRRADRPFHLRIGVPIEPTDLTAAEVRSLVLAL